MRKWSYNFRDNLRIELNYQDITVKELSARTGIPIATLNCYIGARATMPSVNAAVRIAQALQVPVEHLVLSENTKAEKPGGKPIRERQDIIRWIKSLNAEQCRIILKLIKSFQ